MNSFLIRHASICNGTGTEPFFGDLRVRNGVIAEIAPELKPGNEPVFEAEGNFLAPGFIDVHAHSDASILAAPEAFGKISQGVTTEISGNCGLSIFPVMTPEVKKHLEDLLKKYDLHITWTDFTGYADAVDDVRPAVNTMYLCGHNTLRANVLGYGPNPGSPADSEKMAQLLKQMLEQGACGFSTGLLYIPGKFASREELCVLTSQLKNKVYATHLRNEGDSVLEALDEAIAITPSFASLEVSHLKIAFERNFHKIDSLFTKIDTARKNGLRVFADRYPYTFSETSLSVVLPPPYDKMTDRAIQEALCNSPDKVNSLAGELEKTYHSWDRIILCTSADPRVKPYLGGFFNEIAEKLGIPPHRLCAELMAADAVGTMAAFGGLSEDHLHRIVCSDFVCCGTDETARPQDESIGLSHPRGFGSFPEFFRLAHQQLPIGKAIHKMTGLPASVFHISGRGLLKAGYAADMVLLDLKNYVSKADFGKPHTPASGVEAVWVNGNLAYFEQKVQNRAGRVLR